MPDWLQDWLSYDDIVLLAWFFVAIFCLVTLPGFVVVIVQEKAIRKRKSLEDGLRNEMRELGKRRKEATANNDPG